MKDSIKTKLANLQDRYEELAALLSDAEIISNQERFRNLSKEFSEIEPVVKAYTQYEAVLDQLQQAREMQKDADSDIRASNRGFAWRNYWRYCFSRRCQ